MFEQINFGVINRMVSQEFMNICKSHPSCVDCPLKSSDMDIQGIILTCETGRTKENT